MFGVDFSSNSGLRLAIGQAIIDKIQARTQNDGPAGFLSGSSKKGYSKAYRNSVDFDANGKGSKVDLTLTGDMLELMDIVEDGTNTVTVGWSDGEENLKAANHISGDTVPKRDFFGLTSDDVSSIKSEFGTRIKDALKSRGSARQRTIEGLARTIAGTVTTGDDE